MKRAFVVIGPEGSGTYMLAEAFVAAGCTYCDKDDVDDFMIDNSPDLLVLRRSFPHAGTWPRADHIAMKILKYGYSVNVIGIIRDKHATFESIDRRKPEGKSKKEYYASLSMLAEMLELTSGDLISYEYFVLSPRYRRKIFNRYGLKEPRGMEFYDGNRKYN